MRREATNQDAISSLRRVNIEQSDGAGICRGRGPPPPHEAGRLPPFRGEAGERQLRILQLRGVLPSARRRWRRWQVRTALRTLIKTSLLKTKLLRGAVIWRRGFVNNFLRFSLAYPWAAGKLQYSCRTICLQNLFSKKQPLLVCTSLRKLPLVSRSISISFFSSTICSQSKAAPFSAEELRICGRSLRREPDPDAVGQREDARHRPEDASRHGLARAAAATAPAVSAADAPEDGLRGRVGLQVVEEGPCRLCHEFVLVPREAGRIVGHPAAPEGEVVPAERQQAFELEAVAAAGLLQDRIHGDEISLADESARRRRRLPSQQRRLECSHDGNFPHSTAARDKVRNLSASYSLSSESDWCPHDQG